MTNKPLLLGHRGCRKCRLSSQKLPAENSLAALEYALAAGCNGFEFDVRHTRDGHNVLWHDPEWNGFAIAATSETELLDRQSNRLATLEQVLNGFCSRAYLDIELKVTGNEESVLAALKETPPQRGFIVSSFYPDILIRLRELDSELRLGFICDRNDALDPWREMPISVLLPRHDFVTPALIDEAHSRGLQIMTWTVNDPARMRRLADWDIDGLISDDPQLLYQTFHSR